MPRVIESYEEFVHRHGGDLTNIGHNLWILPDGASVRNSALGLDPHLIEPPTDEQARLNARRQYHAAKSDYFGESFAKLKSALQGEGPRFNWDVKKLGPPPDGRDRMDAGQREDEGVAALRLLMEMTHQHHMAIADLDRRLNSLPRVQAERLHNEAKQREDREWELTTLRRSQSIAAQVQALDI